MSATPAGYISLETFITMLVGIALGLSGLIYGLTQRAQASRLKSVFDKMDYKIEALDKKIIAVDEDLTLKNNQSLDDRRMLRKDITDIRGEVNVCRTLLTEIGKTVDLIHKKVYNGGPAK